MIGARVFTAAIGAMATTASLTVVGTSGAAGAAPRPSATTLTGSVAPFADSSRATGRPAGSQKLTIQVWLRPRATAAQAAYALAVSTPGGALFHHYLTPGAWAARFGPGPAAARKVAAWLRATGFTAVHADGHRSYIRATAAISAINSAFHTQVRLYPSTRTVNAGRYRLRANDRPLSVPASIASSVLGVTGIDNAAPVNPMARPGIRARAATAGHAEAAPKITCSHYYGQHVAGHLPRRFGTRSFPTVICGYSGQQLRSAYGANSVNTGRGQVIALVELGLSRAMFRTLQDWAKANRQPVPAPRRYAELSLGRGTACGDPFDVEEQLDVEAAYDMAPGASQLVVGGDSCDNGDFGLQGLFDADLAVLGNGGNPLATVAANSWEGLGGESQPPSLTSIEHAYLVRAATEGVGMYFSSGDESGVHTPSSDPFAIAVGGTTLGIGKTGHRLFETGWSTSELVLRAGRWRSPSDGGDAGGGPSKLWTEPGYQQGVVPARLARAPGSGGGAVRSAPDISADADPFTGFAEGLLFFRKSKPPRFIQIVTGGTSLAAPLVAGIVTAAQQGQRTPFGFINPVLYKLGHRAFFDAMPLTGTSPARWRDVVCGRGDCLGDIKLARFDDQISGRPGYKGQVTLRGYDNMTGIGAPAGQAFITALRKAEKPGK